MDKNYELAQKINSMDAWISSIDGRVRKIGDILESNRKDILDFKIYCDAKFEIFRQQIAAIEKLIESLCG